MSNRDDFIMKPKVDFCFKELMADEEVRRGFISAVLGMKPEEILETELLPTILRKEWPEDKLGILDVRVKINGNQQMDVEIQIAPFEFWAERSLFYLSKMYTEQIKAGEPYAVLQKCIHVGVLDFIFFPEEEAYYSRFHLWEDNRKEKYTDKLEIHILELPKLFRHEYPETELLRWARFLNAERKEEFENMAKEDPYIDKAYDCLTKLSADEIKRLEYEARQKAIRDYNTQALSNWNAGHKAGIQEGIQEGIQQGIQALVKTCQELGVPREKAEEKIVENFQLSLQETKKAVEQYWKE